MTSPGRGSMTSRTGATAPAWEWCVGCLTPPACRRVPRPPPTALPFGAASWWYCRPGISPRRPSSGHRGRSRSTSSTTRCTPWRRASPTNYWATGMARTAAAVRVDRADAPMLRRLRAIHGESPPPGPPGPVHGGSPGRAGWRRAYSPEWPQYPQYYIPLEDVRRDLMIPESHSQHSRRGTFAAHALRVSEAHRPAPPGCLPGEAEVDLAFNVGPFFGLAQPQHQFFKRCCVLGGELKPGQEVEGLSEVTPVVQPSRDCREIVKPGGDVM